MKPRYNSAQEELINSVGSYEYVSLFFHGQAINPGWVFTFNEELKN